MIRSFLCKPCKEFLIAVKWQRFCYLSYAIHLPQNSSFLASRRPVNPGLLSHVHFFASQVRHPLASSKSSQTPLARLSYGQSDSLCPPFCKISVSRVHQEKNSAELRKDCDSHSTQTVPKLSHVDGEGHAQMVDIGAKKDSNRIATATAVVYLGPEAFQLVKDNKIGKGKVLTVAQLAGIMACKSTPSLIPLCHNIHITHSEVNLELDDERHAVFITGTVNSVGKTGVEMESLTSVTIAALTVYDMCKAVSRDIVISDVKLVRKSGGKSGDYVRA